VAAVEVDGHDPDRRAGNQMRRKGGRDIVLGPDAVAHAA
jgi:hypothetical protein